MLICYSQKPKRKRIRVVSDDEDSDKGEEEVDDRDAIQRDLFEGADEEDEAEPRPVEEKPPDEQYADLAGSEEESGRH